MRTTPATNGRRLSHAMNFHDALQHDILASIRIVETLGTDRAVPQELRFWEDRRFLIILNWIALCLAPEASHPHNGLAVSMYTSQGTVYLNLANDDGAPPTPRQCRLEGVFLSTMRNIFASDMGIQEAQDSLNVMLAENQFPAFDQRWHTVGLLSEGSRFATWRDFKSLLEIWRKTTTYNDHNYPAFYNHVSIESLSTIASLLIFRDLAPHINKTSSTDEKHDQMVLIGKACAMLLSSTFYLDMVMPSSRPIRRMDPADNKFAISFIRQVYALYLFTYGTSRFVKAGLRFMRRAMGVDGLSKFMNGEGGIVTNWVEVEPHQPSSLMWRSSPSSAIAEILTLPGLELWDVEAETLEEIPKCDEVLKLWRRGATIDPSPTVHAELVMAHYLEEAGLRVIKGIIGMNRPPCYLCHRYLDKFNLHTRQAYHIPHTDGRTHGPWCLPRPAEAQLHPIASVLRGLRTRIKQAVEEFACEYGF